MMKKKLTIMLFAALIMALLSATALACDHRYGPYWTKRLPTCHQDGLEFRDCLKCDHWEQRDIPKLRHIADAWVLKSEPTCTTKGMETATCTTCGDPMKRYIDMVPHTYGEMEIIKEPTCRGEGKGQYTCAVCGRHKSKTLESLGHDWVVTATTKAPTCKAPGEGEKTCTRCSRVQTGRLNRLEHVWGEFTVTREPSGKKMGERVSTCTLCGEEKKEKFYNEGTLYLDMPACEEVMQLQQMLKDLGYYDGNIRSGQFGAKTGRAVAKFQKNHGLSATEVADAETIEAVRAAWEKKTGKTIDMLVVTLTK